MKPLAPGKKLLIYLEDRSAFDMDIKNATMDTLVLKRTGHEDQIIINKQISIAVVERSDVEILNLSKKNIKTVVRVYNHKSKVINEIK
ncbi:hypothetical protein [Pedobacter jeongneungensis]|uniref:hypothetical protein n=1 Tax=Pedobacter jeongneungensis TaxID=947309 RepID=UPI0013B429B2|nr:hypothetical protein [Pedobacter jeongneungensis]